MDNHLPGYKPESKAWMQPCAESLTISGPGSSESRPESTPPLPSCVVEAPSFSAYCLDTTSPPMMTANRPRSRPPRAGSPPPDLVAAVALFAEGMVRAADLLCPLPS